MKDNEHNVGKMISVHLGNGNIAITQSVDPEIDKISVSFSHLSTVGKLGEQIEEDNGEQICEIIFDNIDGLDNFIKILNVLKKRVYRNNHFYKRMLP